MNRSTPGLPVHHHLPEFTQTHVHRVRDAIQPSHPLPSPSPPTFNLSQHQGFFKSQLFASGGQSIGASASASVLPMNIQGRSPLGWTGLISVQSKGLSRVFTLIRCKSLPGAGPKGACSAAQPLPMAPARTSLGSLSGARKAQGHVEHCVRAL